MHVDDKPHSDRMTVVHRRLESILLYRLDRFLIKSHAEMVNYMDVLWIAITVNDEFDANHALALRLAGLIREIRLYGVGKSGSRYATSYAHDSTAKAAPAAGADTASETLADSTTTTGSLRP